MTQAAFEALKVNVKSFNIVRAITDKNLFSKVKLSPTARLILFSLANMYNPKNGCSFPKVKKLCSCTGCSDRSIEKALQELRKNNLIVSIRDGYKTNYYFTKNFYSLLEIFSEIPEEISKKTEKTSPTCHEQIKKQNKKQVFDKNKILNISCKAEFKDSNSKNRKYHSDCHITGINYPKHKPEHKKKESPLDMTKKQSINFLKNLPKNLQNSFFAVELRKKWNLT